MGHASHLRRRETHKATFTHACLPSSRSMLFFRTLYIFHEPATQATYWYTLIKGIPVKGAYIAFLVKFYLQDLANSLHTDLF